MELANRNKSELVNNKSNFTMTDYLNRGKGRYSNANWFTDAMAQFDPTLSGSEANKLATSAGIPVGNKTTPATAGSSPAYSGGTSPALTGETLIMGMHPITLAIGAVAVLVITGATVMAIKHFKK